MLNIFIFGIEEQERYLDQISNKIKDSFKILYLINSINWVLQIFFFFFTKFSYFYQVILKIVNCHSSHKWRVHSDVRWRRTIHDWVGSGGWLDTGTKNIPANWRFCTHFVYRVPLVWHIVSVWKPISKSVSASRPYGFKKGW